MGYRIEDDILRRHGPSLVGHGASLLLLTWLARKALDEHADPGHESHPPRCTLTTDRLAALLRDDLDLTDPAHLRRGRQAVSAALQPLIRAGIVAAVPAARRRGQDLTLPTVGLTAREWAELTAARERLDPGAIPRPGRRGRPIRPRPD